MLNIICGERGGEVLRSGNEVHGRQQIDDRLYQPFHAKGKGDNAIGGVKGQDERGSSNFLGKVVYGG